MFEPFPMLRALVADRQLSAVQRVVLMCAVLRTENATGRVRASQQMLAEDAGVTVRTVWNVIHSPHIADYFTFSRTSTRLGHRLNLTWRPVGPEPLSGRTGTTFRPSTYIGTKGQRSPSGMRVVPSTGSTPGSQGQAVVQGNRASRQSGVSSTTGTGHGGGSQTGASSTTGPAAPLPLPPRPIEPKRSDYDSGEVFLSDLDEYYDRLDEYISIRMMNDAHGFEEDR